MIGGMSDHEVLVVLARWIAAEDALDRITPIDSAEAHSIAEANRNQARRAAMWLGRLALVAEQVRHREVRSALRKSAWRELECLLAGGDVGESNQGGDPCGAVEAIALDAGTPENAPTCNEVRVEGKPRSVAPGRCGVHVEACRG